MRASYLPWQTSLQFPTAKGRFSEILNCELDTVLLEQSRSRTNRPVHNIFLAVLPEQLCSRSKGLWKSWAISWDMLSEIVSHLLSHQAGCNSPWVILCRLALECGSSRDLSTLSSAETLQMQCHFINYPSSKLHKVWIYLLALLIAHAQFRAQDDIEAQQAAHMSTGLLVCSSGSAVLEFEDDSHKTAFLFSISAETPVVLSLSRGWAVQS